MRIYFITRRQCLLVLAAVLMVIFTGAGLQMSRAIPTGKSGESENLIWQGNTGEKTVFLSVNVDWGEELIPEMLKILESRKAPVTFYVTGTWAEKNPELLKQMAAAGHSIQSHGYKHLHFNQLSRDNAQKEIEKGAAVIEAITGRKCQFFASPYGEFEDSIVQAAEAGGYKLVMWSIDTVDWQKPEPERIVSRVMDKLHNDAIILMHPTEPTVKALPVLLDRIIAQGYSLATIEALAEPQK